MMDYDDYVIADDLQTFELLKMMGKLNTQNEDQKANELLINNV